MNTAHLQLLYGRPPDELLAILENAAKYTLTLCEQLRVDEPGAADRCERLAEHVEGVRRQALVLRQRLLALAEAEGRAAHVA